MTNQSEVLGGDEHGINVSMPEGPGAVFANVSVTHVAIDLLDVATGHYGTIHTQQEGDCHHVELG
jgi:hypothetical protein